MKPSPKKPLLRRKVLRMAKGEGYPRDPRDVSELRQDPITRKWVVIAVGRARRPQSYTYEGTDLSKQPADDARCPFCHPERFPQAPPTLIYPRHAKTNWKIMAFPNKFPAFLPLDALSVRQEGPFTVMDGVGFHEVVVTRAHNRPDALLSVSELDQLWQAYAERISDLAWRDAVSYVQLIQNYGHLSAASLIHPHAQIFALPVLPSDVADLLYGAERYYRQHHSCGYCDILRFEQEKRERLIYKNDAFVVLADFAPRTNYAMKVIPKQHRADFLPLTPPLSRQLAEALKQALGRLFAALGNPAYNYYLHSAPCDTQGYICPRNEFQHFHWHIDILPRLGLWGGLEMATGLEVITALPEQVAEDLRQAGVPQ
jgi:UDPglucose--hexose-1-phosphate uridylyltransferase